MIYAKILYCNIYKDDSLVQIVEYLYDKNYKITNKKFADARLTELVGGYFVRTLQNHYLLLENVRPIVSRNDLRTIKLKKLMDGIR